MRILSHLTKLLASPRYSGPVSQFLEILVLQPTPFCNINCDYCYLPNRDLHQRMSLDTIKKSVRMVLDAGLVDKRLSIAWHAGEPLVLPTDYYEQAFVGIADIVGNKHEISHCFQTNGSLINDAWCEFIKRHSSVRIGVSIDGPSFIHDLHRKTRLGGSTHVQVMRGVEKLKEYGIPFSVIAVLTTDALEHADVMFRFFESLGAVEVGFNVEEQEGIHRSSSLNTGSAADRVEHFWERLYELYEASGHAIQIREFQRATTAILTSQGRLPWQAIARQNDQVMPFRILSVDYRGQVSTFSPELLGVPDRKFGDFIFARAGEDLATIRSSQQFRMTAEAVMKGVKDCSRRCEYFALCGGGAPANKYFENKSFASTATMYCRTSIQIPTLVVLNNLEKKLDLVGATKQEADFQSL
jgi:uncharacterized protein